MATSHLMMIILLFLSLSLSSLSLLESCHPNDKRALLQIKKDLKNPPALNSWNPNTDCCTQWTVVTCNHTTNRVIEIYLYDTKLNLPIPAAVGDLPYLQGIAFRNTSATGPIPQAISKLTELDSLDLEHNLLTGPIPAFLGRLKKLTYIGLSSNRLTGSIPVSLSQLPSLGSLNVSYNGLCGPIPELPRLQINDATAFSHNKCLCGKPLPACK